MKQAAGPRIRIPDNCAVKVELRLFHNKQQLLMGRLNAAKEKLEDLHYLFDDKYKFKHNVVLSPRTNLRLKSDGPAAVEDAGRNWCGGVVEKDEVVSAEEVVVSEVSPLSESTTEWEEEDYALSYAYYRSNTPNTSPQHPLSELLSHSAVEYTGCGLQSDSLSGRFDGMEREEAEAAEPKKPKAMKRTNIPTHSKTSNVQPVSNRNASRNMSGPQTPTGPPSSEAHGASSSSSNRYTSPTVGKCTPRRVAWVKGKAVEVASPSLNKPRLTSYAKLHLRSTYTSPASKEKKVTSRTLREEGQLLKDTSTDVKAAAASPLVQQAQMVKDSTPGSNCSSSSKASSTCRHGLVPATLASVPPALSSSISAPTKASSWVRSSMGQKYKLRTSQNTISRKPLQQLVNVQPKPRASAPSNTVGCPIQFNPHQCQGSELDRMTTTLLSPPPKKPIRMSIFKNSGSSQQPALPSHSRHRQPGFGNSDILAYR